MLLADVIDSLIHLNKTLPHEVSLLLLQSPWHLGIISSVTHPIAIGRASCMQAQIPGILKVTFLGSDRNEIHGTPSRQYIARRAITWGPTVHVTVITDKDSAAALRYLKGPGRVAIMPSLIENRSIKPIHAWV